MAWDFMESTGGYGSDKSPSGVEGSCFVRANMWVGV